MAGKVSSGGGRRGAMQPNYEPNVIPFIDILLVLLIIFMVTAPLPTVDLRVDLPPPNPVPIHLEGLNPTVVGIREGAGGLEIFVDEQTGVPLSQLGEVTLQHAERNNPALDFRDLLREARISVSSVN